VGDELQLFRILHCLRAPVGGLFRHVYDLATEQARQGHDVGILCDLNTGDSLTEATLAELADICTLGVHRTAMSRLISHHDPMALRRTVRLARELRCDVLHGHGAKGGIFARIASRSNRRHGIPANSFYTPHGGTLNYKPGSLVSGLFLAIEKQLLPLTDGLCFESQYACDKFHEMVATPSCTVRVIPNGVRPSEFGPHVLNEDAADFIFLGEIREVKGVDLLVEAVARLKTSHNATASIVGDGPLRGELQHRAAELGISDNLDWPGALPAGEAFKRGRVFVLPSRYESFPYVVLEAAARGVPALVTDVGGVAEITAPGDPHLIPPDCVDALTQALSEMLNHPEALRTRTEALRERVKNRFTTVGMAESVVDVYHSLTSESGSAEPLAA